MDGLFADQVVDDPEKLALIQRLYANPANSIDDIRRTPSLPDDALPTRKVWKSESAGVDCLPAQLAAWDAAVLSGTLAAWRWRRLSRSAAASLVQLVVR